MAEEFHGNSSVVETNCYVTRGVVVSFCFALCYFCYGLCQFWASSSVVVGARLIFRFPVACPKANPVVDHPFYHHQADMPAHVLLLLQVVLGHHAHVCQCLATIM
jgi:hypothetical protein